MRVYEFAKLLNVTNKELVVLLAESGFEVKSHMSTLNDEAIDFLNKKLAAFKEQEDAKQKKEEKKHEPEIKPIYRAENLKPAEVKVSEIEKPTVVAEHIIEKEFIVEPMTVGRAAELLGQPVSEVILLLLKQGMICAKNQMLAEKTIEQLARHFKFVVKYPAVSVKQEIRLASPTIGTHVRYPVIVIVGHVDHGKTTLLDFIRKTKVAAKEKGGITQHLGAYEVSTPQGNLVFLDTPGHEAFSNIRGRGLNVADIAVLVVAADDSVMPQTIEAIKRAKAINIPLVVAVNKMDKVEPTRLEAIKRDLARYDVIVEEWGGQTVCIPISAKTGKGVDQLLEMLVLQAEIMDLKSDLAQPAIGFVLESKLEKGRGAVATVICRNGTLRVGDYFATGHIVGKVSSMIDSYGKSLKEAMPSIPVQVAGFSELPKAGDFFEVIPQEKYRQLKTIRESRAIVDINKKAFEGEALNIIIKTDTMSSQEALMQSIEKLSEKSPKKFNIIYAGIGAISESDVALAVDTGAYLFGLHVKVDPTALAESQKNSISIHLFDIIYQLLENLEKLVKIEEKPRLVLKKIGEAIVRKIFDIKNIGKIAGSYVKEGRFSKDCSIIIWRGKKKVAETTIKGLERDRKPVKEVHAGFEFAFLADGFNDWELEDRIECFLNVPEK